MANVMPSRRSGRIYASPKERATLGTIVVRIKPPPRAGRTGAKVAPLPEDYCVPPNHLVILAEAPAPTKLVGSSSAKRRKGGGGTKSNGVANFFERRPMDGVRFRFGGVAYEGTDNSDMVRSKPNTDAMITLTPAGIVSLSCRTDVLERQDVQVGDVLEWLPVGCRMWWKDMSNRFETCVVRKWSMDNYRIEDGKWMTTIHDVDIVVDTPCSQRFAKLLELRENSIRVDLNQGLAAQPMPVAPGGGDVIQVTHDLGHHGGPAAVKPGDVYSSRSVDGINSAVSSPMKPFSDFVHDMLEKAKTATGDPMERGHGGAPMSPKEQERMIAIILTHVLRANADIQYRLSKLGWLSKTYMAVPVGESNVKQAYNDALDQVGKDCMAYVESKDKTVSDLEKCVKAFGDFDEAGGELSRLLTSLEEEEEKSSWRFNPNFGAHMTCNGEKMPPEMEAWYKEGTKPKDPRVWKSRRVLCQMPDLIDKAFDAMPGSLKKAASLTGVYSDVHDKVQQVFAEGLALKGNYKVAMLGKGFVAIGIPTNDKKVQPPVVLKKASVSESSKSMSWWRKGGDGGSAKVAAKQPAMAPIGVKGADVVDDEVNPIDAHDGEAEAASYDGAIFDAEDYSEHTDIMSVEMLAKIGTMALSAYILYSAATEFGGSGETTEYLKSVMQNVSVAGVVRGASASVSTYAAGLPTGSAFFTGLKAYAGTIGMASNWWNPGPDGGAGGVWAAKARGTEVAFNESFAYMGPKDLVYHLDPNWEFGEIPSVEDMCMDPQAAATNMTHVFNACMEKYRDADAAADSVTERFVQVCYDHANAAALAWAAREANEFMKSYAVVRMAQTNVFEAFARSVGGTALTFGAGLKSIGGRGARGAAAHFTGGESSSLFSVPIMFDAVEMMFNTMQYASGALVYNDRLSFQANLLEMTKAVGHTASAAVTIVGESGKRISVSGGQLLGIFGTIALRSAMTLAGTLFGPDPIVVNLGAIARSFSVGVDPKDLREYYDHLSRPIEW